MKGTNFITTAILFTFFSILQSCGPIVISSTPSSPPPPWFYPNRVETVRYVYFPEYTIYFDLIHSSYIYLDGGAWVTVKVLPPRYRTVNLRRSRYVRVRNYYGDNIRKYHTENRTNPRSRTRSTTTRSRR